MIEPLGGVVYDPCCGSGGMFVQSLRFVESHGGTKCKQLSIYGQELNSSTWRIARMNLTLHGLNADLGEGPADAFFEDVHPQLRAHYILANPPFNMSDWGVERLLDDERWEFGVPPAGNANFAWVQHIVKHLDRHGVAGIVLANGSMTSLAPAEAAIRRGLVEANLVDAMVALPGQLFYSTSIPACLWFIRKDRAATEDVLFIDARSMGHRVTRAHRALNEDEVLTVADMYHAWRRADGAYRDVPGFIRSVSRRTIEATDFILSPARYVGSKDAEEPDAREVAIVLEELRSALDESARLDREIRRVLTSEEF
jgi:type I restriction enzyme M protein